MARWIVDPPFEYRPKPTKPAEPHKLVVHGKPRWGYAFRRGKGGEETRPPYHVAGSHARPNVSPGAKTKLLNLVADAANRHGMPIPAIERRGKAAEIADLRLMLKALDTAEAKERNKRARMTPEPKLGERIAPFGPRPSDELFCGKCGKVIPRIEVSFMTYTAHRDDCPRRPELWKQLVEQRNMQAARFYRRVGNVAQIRPMDEKPQDQYNASDIAIAESKRERVQYRNASEYSDT